jgi:hypothetical protein
MATKNFGHHREGNQIVLIIERGGAYSIILEKPSPIFPHGQVKNFIVI